MSDSFGGSQWGTRPTTPGLDLEALIPPLVRSGRILIFLILALVTSAPAAAQSVSGRVISAQTDRNLPGARVALLTADGSRIATVVTGDDGTFYVAALNPGPHRLEVNHSAYSTLTTEIIELRPTEEVIVDVRLTAAAIQLDPLIVTARRSDHRQEPTHQGFYARQSGMPHMGSALALTRNDPEMFYSSTVHEVMRFVGSPRRSVVPQLDQSALPESMTCLVLYWNGRMVHSEDEALFLLGTSPHVLEGVEYYRYNSEAPPAFRDVPMYLMGCPLHSTLALWSYTGHFGPAPAFGPAFARIDMTAGVYDLSGDAAPGMGVGVEASVSLPLWRRTALGLLVGRSAHQLPAEVVAHLVPEEWDWPYMLPAGDRPLTLWTGGVEPRVVLPAVGPVRPYAAARFLLARRSFTMESTSAAVSHVHISSWGGGAGITLGGEARVRGRYVAQLAVGHDRFAFGAYEDIERERNPTSGSWAGTSLRLGFGYGLGR